MTELAPVDLVEQLRGELASLTPDVWPEIHRAVRARRVASDLLAGLDRPLSLSGRISFERRVLLRDAREWLAV